MVSLVARIRAEFVRAPAPDAPNIAAFRKVWTDARDWQHFVPFMLTLGACGADGCTSLLVFT